MPPTVQEINTGGQSRMTKRSYIVSLLSSFFAICALILGTGSNIYCESVKFTTQVDGNNNLVMYAGPWNYRTQDSYKWNDPTFASQSSCRNYDSLGIDYTVDATTKTVWSFAIIAPIFGILLSLGACFGAFVGSRASRWKCMGSMFIFVSVLQGLTLLIESSSICYDNPAIQYLEVINPDLANTMPETCEWAIGFKANIVAIVLWIIAGTCALVLPPPVIIREHTHQGQTVTYTQNADGTVQENHVTIVKGTPVQ